MLSFVSHAHAANNSLKILCRQPLATFMTVLAIAVMLTLPALFWVFTDNVEHLTSKWQRGEHISLYLKSSLSSADETAFLSQVRAEPGVGDATLKSAEEGLAELRQQEGMQDVMQYLTENPLPAVIEVVPTVDANTPEKLQQLYTKLQTLAPVEQAKVDMQWINRLDAIVHFLSIIARGLMMLLAVAVILIIGNTLRLAVHKRHEEIQVLKLIGAADSYIVRPFLYSGMLYGMAGAVFAVLLINIFIISMALVVNQLASAYQMHYVLLGLSLRQATLLILSAIVLGWLGARLSVKRQLASIEPYN